MTAPALPLPATRFVLPPGVEAAEPPEHRGLLRDGVRLLAVDPRGTQTRRFHDLPDLLEPGDLLVVNTSATLAAALDGTRADGRAVPVHVATPLAADAWVVELRAADGSGPDLTGVTGERVLLPQRSRCRAGRTSPGPAAGTEPAVAGRAVEARRRRGIPRSARPSHRLRLPGRALPPRVLPDDLCVGTRER